MIGLAARPARRRADVFDSNRDVLEDGRDSIAFTREQLRPRWVVCDDLHGSPVDEGKSIRLTRADTHVVRVDELLHEPAVAARSPGHDRDATAKSRHDYGDTALASWRRGENRIVGKQPHHLGSRESDRLAR